MVVDDGDGDDDDEEVEFCDGKMKAPSFTLEWLKLLIGRGKKDDIVVGDDEDVDEFLDGEITTPSFMCCSSSIFSSCATPRPLCGTFFCFGLLVDLPPLIQLFLD